MKKLITICLLLVAMISCSPDKPKSSSEVQWNSSKNDSVVYVNYQREDGSFTNFYMNYILYSMLFNRGGYNGVYNYYNTHSSEFSNQSKYSNYSRVNSPSYYPSKTISTGSYSSPSRHTIPSSISSPSRQSTPSYSSPSRSYSSPAYSSPSRSYSSPAYSSPSRSSYSSPSRR